MHIEKERPGNSKDDSADDSKYWWGRLKEGAFRNVNCLSPSLKWGSSYVWSDRFKMVVTESYLVIVKILSDSRMAPTFKLSKYLVMSAAQTLYCPALPSLRITTKAKKSLTKAFNSRW